MSTRRIRGRIPWPNNNIRTARFETLAELAALEQVIYAPHYDKNTAEGSPMNVRVKVALVRDLSALTNARVGTEAVRPHTAWSDNRSRIIDDDRSVNEVIGAIDAVRGETKTLPAMLR